jgi:hypothetical protein
MFNLLLIGAGRLGSRYLQGLINSKSQLSITVVDPSQNSLEAARKCWLEALNGNESIHQISWLQTLPYDIQRVDLTLVITSSKGRANLVRKVAESFDVRYWVLEKILAQSIVEIGEIRFALAGSSGAWINTPRRIMPWHQALRGVFFGNGPLTVSYAGGSWGLACNAIHFLDLVSWWTGETLVSVNTKGLEHKWQKSKREDYFEVGGELIAHYSCGTTLTLKANEGVNEQKIQIQLCDGVIWEVDEHAGSAKGSDGHEINGKVLYQSELSSQLVDRILQFGDSGLPSFEESSTMHEIFLDAMLKHWNFSHNRNDLLIPIT